MTNKQEALKKLKSYLQRSFPQGYVMENIISQGRERFLKWNIDKIVFSLTNLEGECCGSIFKVNTPTYSDMVLVTLSYNDLFQVRFFDENFKEIVEMVDDVNVGDLFEVIDQRINKFQLGVICLN